jgi:hypothetical protein
VMTSVRATWHPARAAVAIHPDAAVEVIDGRTDMTAFLLRNFVTIGAPAR